MLVSRVPTGYQLRNVFLQTDYKGFNTIVLLEGFQDISLCCQQLGIIDRAHLGSIAVAAAYQWASPPARPPA